MALRVYDPFEDELQKRMALARRQGWSEDEINRSAALEKQTYAQQSLENRFKQKMNQDQPTSGRGGFLSSLISEISGAGGAGVGALIGSAAGPLGTLAGGAIGGFLGGTGGSAVEQQVRDDDVDVGKALKEGAWSGVFGAGPIRAGKAAVAGGRALAGGAGKTVAKEAAEKAATTSLLKPVINKLQAKGTASFLGLDRTAFKNAREAGIDIPKLTQKWRGIVRTKPDDLLGSTTERGFGGKIGRLIKNEEDVIQGVVGNSNKVIPIEGFVDDMAKLQQSLVRTPGNENRVKALSNLVDSTINQYSKGIPEKDALKLLRSANEQFGKNITDVSEFSPTIRDFQKGFANFIRKNIKQTPEVSRALNNQKELITLRELANVARDKGASRGLDVGAAGIGGTAYNAAVRNRQVGGRLAVMTPERPITIPNTATRAGVGGLLNLGEPTEQPLTEEQALQQTFEQNPDLLAMANGQTTGSTGNLLNETNGTTKQALSSQDLFNAAMQALAAGDAKNAELLGGFAEMAAGFEEFEAEKAGGGTLSSEAAKMVSNADSGMESLGQIEAIINQEGGVPKGTLVPGRGLLGGFGANLLGSTEYDTAAKNLSDVITRLRTGAALNASEEGFYKSQVPQAFDSPEAREQKLALFRNLFNSIKQNVQGTSNTQDLLEQLNRGQ